MSFIDKLDPNKNGVSNFFKGVPHQAAQPLEQAIHGAMDEMHNFAKELEKGFYDTQNKVAINLRGEAEKGVKKIQGVAGDIEGVGKKAIGEIENKGKQIVDDAEEAIKNAIYKLEEEFSKKAVKTWLKFLLATVKDVPITNVRAGISVFTFSLSEPFKLVGVIEEAIKNPPSGHEEVLKFIEEKLDVATVSADFDAEVITNAAGFRFGGDMSIAQAIVFVPTAAENFKKALKGDL